jgi:hypothetical protein
LPFQRTASGCVGDFTVDRTLPTATQLFGAVHDTALRTLDSALAVTGLGSIAHFLPVQCSMSARDFPCFET